MGTPFVMLSRQDVVKGRYLRTRSASFGVPAGSLAQIDTVGTTWQGEFVFIVRWVNSRTGTQARAVTDRSLNLWEQDLVEFEAVQEEDISSRATDSPPSRKPKLALQVGSYRKFRKSKTASIGQLSLFTSEDF
jgi:hypothetical protein